MSSKSLTSKQRNCPKLCLMKAWQSPRRFWLNLRPRRTEWVRWIWMDEVVLKDTDRRWSCRSNCAVASSYINVTTAIRPSRSLVTWLDTSGYTRERSHLFVRSVIEGSLSSPRWIAISRRMSEVNNKEWIFNDCHVSPKWMLGVQYVLIRYDLYCTGTVGINALHAKFFSKNINLYLQLISFLHTDITQFVEILLM